MEELENIKQIKKMFIYDKYKYAIMSAEAIVNIGGVNYLFGTRNDYEAYKDMVLSWGTITTKKVKDRNNNIIMCTRSDVELIVKSLYDVGESLWIKKETLYYFIDNSKTIGELESIVW